MTRIGIATLHYGFNEGAILQAYCLSAAISELPTVTSAHIIDQRYPGKVQAYGPPNTPRLHALADAIDTWLPLTTQRFHEENERSALRALRTSYDFMVVGSDQVWGMRFRRRLWPLPCKQPGGFHPPIPNIYFPDADAARHRIAYAPSVGASDYRAMPRGCRENIRERLGSFRSLSARDARTLRFLEWLHPDLRQRAILVPDPTRIYNILSEPTSTEVRQKLEDLGIDFSRKRIAVVANGGSAIQDYVAQRKRRDTQIIGLSYHCPGVDIDLCNADLSPIEWAHAFKHFDLCVTERMHASIFCTLNKTPVIAVDINDNVERSSTKLTEFFEDIQHPSFCLPKNTACRNDIEQLEAAVEMGGWHQDTVDLANEESRARGLGFLQQSLAAR